MDGYQICGLLRVDFGSQEADETAVYEFAIDGAGAVTRGQKVHFQHLVLPVKVELFVHGNP